MNEVIVKYKVANHASNHAIPVTIPCNFIEFY